MTQLDWRYSEEKLELRELVISCLLQEFGSQLSENGEPVYSNKSIYECAHDWVSQGNSSTLGLLKYYKSNYCAVREALPAPVESLTPDIPDTTGSNISNL